MKERLKPRCLLIPGTTTRQFRFLLGYVVCYLGCSKRTDDFEWCIFSRMIALSVKILPRSVLSHDYSPAD